MLETIPLILSPTLLPHPLTLPVLLVGAGLEVMIAVLLGELGRETLTPKCGNGCVKSSVLPDSFLKNPVPLL